MRRREFIAGLGAAGACATAPRLARAQQDTRVRRLISLGQQSENQTQTEINGVRFRNELATLGWVEGRNLQIDVRYGRGDVDRMRANAAEVVVLAPDVIVASGPSMVRIAQQQTKTIPIVISFAGDVFANGLVKNLAHPEGNTTGITGRFQSMAGKWVELLKEAVPQVERVGYIHDPEFEPSRGVPEEIEKASRVLAVRTTAIAFHDAVDLVHGIDAFAAEPDGGLLIPPSVTAGNYRAAINALAIQYRLPTIYNTRIAFEGGLILYGARAADIVVRTAYFIDRILRGAKPSDLPVEYPTRFELVVNLKTAKAIGLSIPEALLVRADEVIE
jgi:putative tryptophan/tyrosine transport system substrate-binding protein